MGKVSTIYYLSPEQQKRVDTLLREYHYSRYDHVLAKLGEEGITIKRSSLHRYGLKLKRAEQGCVDGFKTMIVVVDGLSGRVRAIPTMADSDSVVSALAEYKNLA